MEKGLIVDLRIKALRSRLKDLTEVLVQISQSESYDNNTTKGFFRIVKHPALELGAMMFDDMLKIPIVPYRDEAGNLRPKVIAAYKRLADTLGYTHEQAKRFIENNDSFTVEQIVIPKLPMKGVKIELREQMQINGWDV